MNIAAEEKMLNFHFSIINSLLSLFLIFLIPMNKYGSGSRGEDGLIIQLILSLYIFYPHEYSSRGKDALWSQSVCLIFNFRLLTLFLSLFFFYLFNPHE